MNTRSFLPRTAAVLVAVVPIVSLSVVQVNADTPANIDGTLRRMIEQQHRTPDRNLTARLKRQAMFDDAGRVLVNVHLDGSAALEEVRGAVNASGARMVAESSTFRKGVVSAYLPVAQLETLAKKRGVLSVTLGSRAITHIGATTSGGVPVIRSNVLNAQGIDGTGLTVGALSDSYDLAKFGGDGSRLRIHAAQDVASGDLPGRGNPENPNPVVVLDDYHPQGPNDTTATDEGRAMLQIVHDIAPKAKLAFASAFNGEVAFAANIRKLRTEAKCDVIVDDVGYFDEPYFSDGIVAQAVDEVSTSTSIPGKKCAYFSSAGNQQGGGWIGEFTPVADSVARAGVAGQNLKLDQVPEKYTSGGFHNFNAGPGKAPDISQTFALAAGSSDSPTSVFFIFQWDDPFYVPGGVTTDYNILVFDADGNYLSSASGIDVNAGTQTALEYAFVENEGAATTFQIAITRAGTSPQQPIARRLRYLATDQFSDGYGANEYYQPDAPATGGHPCAKNAIGVAAYVYDDPPSNPPAPPYTPVVEDYTSNGPVIIALDASGHRLSTPELRLKPDIAAPDGGNTTFFGFDYEGDGFPNFFGTSAAAPHGAGAAALLLQKAGGPESLTTDQIRSALQGSAAPHDLNSFFIEASAGNTVVTGHGNDTNASSADPNFFKITFRGGDDESLLSVTINIAPAGLKFDSTTTTGFPLTLGNLVGVKARDISSDVLPENSTFPKLTLRFAPGAFRAGDSVSFGIDRDIIGDGGGNDADFLENATLSARTNTARQTGTFTNSLGKGFASVQSSALTNPRCRFRSRSSPRWCL